MFGNVLLIAVVVLMFVLLVPVGIAVYQRLRVKTDDKSGRAAPPPPETARRSWRRDDEDAGHERCRRRCGGGSRPPAGAMPRPPEGHHDRAAGPRQVDRGPRARAARRPRWCSGSACCTAPPAPLEGQRFIIEENGVYIGRDADHVADRDLRLRISKRHVRIVPRDGKVHGHRSELDNGTFLGSAGGQRITEVQLKRGDTSCWPTMRRRSCIRSE